MITSFITSDGAHTFLSNFYRESFICDGLPWPSVEHYYQAMKTLDFEARMRIRAAVSPGQAKRLGREYILRPEWETIKVGVMWVAIRQKFGGTTDRGLAMQKLLRGTEPHELVEGNYWHDNEWGDCTCNRPGCRMPGYNKLGRILMAVRDELP